jgi:hypothetical protein
MGGGHFGRFYPWGDPRRHRTACRTLDCYHCNWRCPYATVRCLEQIRPADVLAEALAALAAASDDATVPRPHRSRERVTSGVCTAGRQSAAGDACGVATLDAPAGGPAAVSAIQRVVGPVQDKPQETAGSEDSRRACFRRLWRDLAQTGEPVAIFGAGAQTFWLLQAVWDVPGPAVTCVLDDAAKPGQRDVGHPVVRPVAGEPPCRRILVSSDACEERLVQRCRELYGDAVEVIRLSGAPLGRGSSC